MNKDRRDGIVIVAAVSVLSACFVSSANTYQDQFAQEVCEKALFVSGDDYSVQMKKRISNASRCEFTIDQIDGARRANLSRWFVGIIFSSVIVGGVIKTLE